MPNGCTGHVIRMDVLAVSVDSFDMHAVVLCASFLLNPLSRLLEEVLLGWKAGI